MSDGITFTIVGDDRLLRKLDRIAKKDARAAIRKGTRAGAKIVTARTKALAPVSGSRQTGKKTKKGGTLRRAIRTRSAKRSRVFIGSVTRLGAGFFKGETFYGAFQEFGWTPGKRRIGGVLLAGARRRTGLRDNPNRGKPIEGKHFMERAAKQVGRKAMRVATDIIAREIERAARRNG